MNNRILKFTLNKCDTFTWGPIILARGPDATPFVYRLDFDAGKLFVECPDFTPPKTVSEAKRPFVDAIANGTPLYSAKDRPELWAPALHYRLLSTPADVYQLPDGGARIVPSITIVADSDSDEASSNPNPSTGE